MANRISAETSMLIGSEKCTLIRSDRKTLSLQLRSDGSILIRAPRRAGREQIRNFVLEHAQWIEKHRQKMQLREQAEQEQPEERLTPEQIQELAQEALKVIPERVRYFAPIVGVTYGRITIRNQRSRWGSCSSKGNLNFNCLLMLCPPEVIDSVIVHELCHRKEMNHSSRFYAHVYRVFPEYDRWHGWLKKNGGRLIRRMTG